MKNRTIKFKAKRIDNGEWVEGDLLTDGKGGNRYILPIEANCFDEYEEVKPKTVCQYTGLKDKNGKEVFEGDNIFINRIGDYPVNQHHHVIYNSDFATFATNIDRTFDWMRYEGKFEITGNIHDKTK